MATERMFAEQGLKFKVRMELGSTEAIKQAVIGGLGISVLSKHTLELDAPGQFVMLDVQGFPIQRHWYFACPVGKSLFRISLKGASRRWKRTQNAHVLRVHSAFSSVSALRCIP